MDDRQRSGDKGMMSYRRKLTIFWIVFWLIVGVLWIWSVSCDASMPDEVIKQAESLSYVREITNNNDHPMIDKMLAYIGLPPRLSWCMAFGVYCFHLAADVCGIKNPLPKIGRCSLFWQRAKADKFRYKIITRTQALWGVYALNKADVGIFSHNRSSGNNNWNGHAVLVTDEVKNGKFKTIEGNTVCENCPGDQREGGGVFHRIRSLAPGSFQIEGFVRPI
jgi:hypothetical protein